jgi:hypothetical protein
MDNNWKALHESEVQYLLLNLFTTYFVCYDIFILIPSLNFPSNCMHLYVGEHTRLFQMLLNYLRFLLHG